MDDYRASTDSARLKTTTGTALLLTLGTELAAVPAMADPDREPADEEELRRLFDKAAHEEYTRQALAKAREDFPEFYAAAGGDDAEHMDSLVLAKEAARALNIAWRQLLPKEIRPHFETTSDKVDQLYAAARETVRGCATFQRLDVPTQERIEAALFTV